jgi:diaminopimelate decarboxylase
MPAPRLVLEPGRSIAARAGVAAYRIVARKDFADIAAAEGPSGWLHLDGGMADNPRPALYGARYEAALAARMEAPRTERVSLAGRYCESSDVLVADAMMPTAAPGEVVVVPGAGAYTQAMASNYNLSRRPAVIAVNEGHARLVQRRETFDDLIARDV